MLYPEGWNDIEGLIAGFGEKADPLPDGARFAVQVHGPRLVDGNAALPVETEADAVSVSTPGATAAVKTADCVPVLIVSPRIRWAAAVHAGWRGTAAGIVAAAVAAAREAGGDPRAMRAAIGPAIGSCCYEVSDEVAQNFADRKVGVERSGDKPRLDLREINRFDLVRAGLRLDAIQTVGPCTRCSPETLWSFRLDGERAGRQWSWIGWEDRTR